MPGAKLPIADIFFAGRAARQPCVCQRIHVAAMLDLDARGALLLLVWVLLNLLLNFFNKWALSPMVIELSWGGSLIHESLRGPSNGAGFSFPLFYSMCHMAASFVGASLIFLCQPSTNRVSTQQLRNHGPSLFVLALLFALNICGNNASLVSLGIAVNQLVKSVTPLPSMLFAYALQRRTFSAQLIGAVLFLTASAAAAIPWGSEAADGQGIGLAAASMLAAAAKPALAACLGRDMRRDGLTPLALVWWDSLFASAITGALCLLSTERDTVADYCTSKPALAAFVILTSSVLAFCYNLVVYSLSTAASPVVSVIASNFKQVVLIVLAGILVDRITHPLNWVGIGFFFVATFLYSYLALNQPPPSQLATRRGASATAAPGGGTQPDGLPQRTIRWSHKGIVASASTASETTPLRRPGEPPQTRPWYAGSGRAAKKGKGAVVKPGGA